MVYKTPKHPTAQPDSGTTFREPVRRPRFRNAIDIEPGMWRQIVGMYAAAGEPLPDADASVKVLLRLFVHFHGERVILLVHGYDKGDNPSARQQQIEIKRAGKALTAWRLAEARRIKAAGRQPKKK